MAGFICYLLVDTFLMYSIHNISFRVSTNQCNIFQLIAAYMMIEALNKKGFSAFAISIPSPSEFMQIFAIAAPVFVTMFSKVCYILLYSTICAHGNKIMHLCVSDV
jgi:hypothetical protein